MSQESKSQEIVELRHAIEAQIVALAARKINFEELQGLKLIVYKRMYNSFLSCFNLSKLKFILRKYTFQ